jgi:hypothetical protein
MAMDVSAPGPDGAAMNLRAKTTSSTSVELVQPAQ